MYILLGKSKHVGVLTESYGVFQMKIKNDIDIS